jgi:hypothetical protein
MSIPTANVIVGFDRDAMLKYFSVGETYQSLVTGITDEVLLFDSESNPNFISFEHSLLDGKFEMKLTFIDPKGDFERRFFSDNIPRNIAAYSDDPNLATKLNNLTLGDIQNNEQVSDPDSSKAEEQLKASQLLYSPKFYEDTQKELAKYYYNNSMYVAYGSGSDLASWSGPHRVLLTHADIAVKGPRKITLTLSPTASPIRTGNRTGAYNEKVNLDLGGLSMRFKGMSKPILFSNLVEGKAAYDPLHYLGLDGSEESIVTENRSAISQALSNTGLAGLSSQLADFDFHSILVDALREYVQKAAGTPNVIILLPNINVTCRYIINALLNDTRASAPSLEQLERGRVLRDWNYNPILETVGFKEQFLTNFLNAFGLGLEVVHKEGSSQVLDVGAAPTSNLATKQDYEKGTSYNERVRDYYKVNNFYAEIGKASNEGIPEHLKTVKDIIKNINRWSKEEYQVKLKVYDETDLQVLNLWAGNNKKYPITKSTTFGGYREFLPTKNAVIIGDQGLIQQYLYGGVSLDSKFKSIQAYKDSAALAQSNHDKYQKIADDLQYSWENTPQAWALHATQYTEGDTDWTPWTQVDAAGPNAPTGKLSALAKANEALEDLENSILGAIKAIPLHPLDAITLVDKDYNEAIRSIIRPSMGAFGDVSDLPDSFGYLDRNFSDASKSRIENNKIPVFRYNTTNPNVLNMDFKFAGVYLAQLKAGFSKVVNRKASAVVEGILPFGTGSFPIRSRLSAIKYLKQKGFSLGMDEDTREEIKAELAGKVNSNLLASLGTFEPEKAADALAAILDIMEQGDNADLKGLIKIDQEAPGNPQSIITDLAEDMYRNALTMVIKTLPMFQISNIHNIASPCLVFAQEAPIKQSIPKERSTLDHFYSGFYMVMGYRHTINTTTASSEFMIVKSDPKYSEESE